MTHDTEIKNHYLADFDLFASNGAADALPWIQQLRRDAIGRFEHTPFPTIRDEEWRFTNVAPIIKTQFRTSRATPSVTEADIEPFLFGDAGWSRLIFVNGRYNADLSKVSAALDGVRIGNLAEVTESDSELVREHLDRLATKYANAFSALNSAFIRDGLFIHVPNGMVIEEPVQVLYLSTGGDAPTVSYPRNLFVVGRGARIEIAESYVSLADGTYFTNGITEAVLGEGAILKRYKIQNESERAFHIESMIVHQERSSFFTSFSTSVGAGLSRNEVDIILDGEGSECVLDGLYIVNGARLADNHITIDHAKPNCNSHQVYKGILDGNGRAVFNGKIIVREDAQKTDAKQTNRNLLLSEGAVVDSKPQLEIFADDVKCTHGATVGQLDEDALFYMRSRGISQELARTLLTFGFAEDLVSRITLDPLRVHLEHLLMEKLHVQPQAIEIG
jgi:Fe-S cluster assembly protein SufD